MPRWTDIERKLKEAEPAARMRDSAAFWADFRAHAPMYPQLAPETTRAPAIFRWSLATACALLLVTGVTVHSLRPGLEVEGNTITALDIAAPHRAVFIMNDKASGGTLLWIDCDATAQAVEGAVL